MRRWREAAAALARLDVRQTAKASARGGTCTRASSTEVFDTPGDVSTPRTTGHRRRWPCGVSRTPARRSTRASASSPAGHDQGRARYRALRPEALAMLEYLGAGTKAISGTGRSSSRAPCATPATSAS